VPVRAPPRNPRGDMSEYAEYVNGRSIAVVGRARPFADQSAEVEGHDLVAVTSYNGTAVPEYHSRCDISVYNRRAAAWLREKKSRARLLGVEWFLFRTGRVEPPSGVKTRIIGGPAFFGGLGNQIPVFLNDIVRFSPSRVSIYGTDLYLSGYDTTRPWGNLGDFEAWKQGTIEHDQPKVRRYYQLMCELYPFIVPDVRLDRILGMTDSEFWAELNRVWGEL
jgi:hypothetical protein